MTAEEMDNMFEVLYNNVDSRQAPGLNAYEKSVFLTKGQDEILKNYFNSKSKGNNVQEGFDMNPKRQIDFSMLTTIVTITSSSYTQDGIVTSPIKPPVGEITSDDSVTEGQTAGGTITPGGTGTLKPGGTFPPSDSFFYEALFDTRPNTKSIKLPDNLMMAINEVAEVTRGSEKNAPSVILQVVPIKYDEYSRLMSKPYKRPLKYQAWRLISTIKENRADIVIGPEDTLKKYIIRYIKRPTPIVVADLDGLTIDGDATGKKMDCILDPILHEEIVQRAVELAKIAWASTGQDNAQLVLQAGQRSE